MQSVAYPTVSPSPAAAHRSDPDAAFRLLALVMAAHHRAIDTAGLRHSAGHGGEIDPDGLVRLAKHLPDVRAKRVRATSDTLQHQPLPALGHGDEGWFIISRAAELGVVIQRDGKPPEILQYDALSTIWSGDLVLIAVRAEGATSLGRFDARWFMPQIVRYRHLIGEVLLMTLALNLLGLAAPLLYQNVIDKVLVHQTLSTLNVLAFAFVAVSLWEVAFGWLRTRLFSETGQKIDVELGARLMRHVFALPIAYFEKRRVGDTITRIRQLETIREFCTNASLTVMVDPAFALIFLVAMLAYSPSLSLIPLCAIVGYVLVSLLVTPMLRRRLDEKFERGSESNALLVESMSGIQTIKAAAVEPQWQNAWESRIAAYSSATQRVTNLGATGSQMIELISKLSAAAILFFGAKAVIAGTLSVGGLVAFNMFAQRLAAPVVRMAQLWQEFQQVRISIHRLGDVLDHPPEFNGRSRLTLPPVRGAVAFENVRFRYDSGGADAISDVSLSVAPGETIGVVGSSGSGKSTLTKLIQRMYAPQEGRVLIDGHDLAHADPAWIRRQVGIVLQDNLLFNRSLRDNIALSDPSMPMERVMEAARLAGADEFIRRLPEGYDTEVVERGQNLSGGQRQRIAIARALAAEPRILILDEATSALDAESEEILRTNLIDIAKGRTVIIIAHRLSAVSACDRIYALERGRIVESGDHGTLMRSGGRYADLYNRQHAIRDEAA